MFYGILIICKETSIFHYGSKSKRESMEWRYREFPPPQNMKVSDTTKNLIMPVFWDSK
ncbi:hypothetical protein CAPTEDRAFT_122040 [Capitella teleta]|uniref:Uncharacterized protein n=1 Tax=Capitella teleta TaxID=283909 RepID=R7V1Y7_CAPTE|nr:hypothetical protein CAPTEDRAFT_122040 [Capitella teleta]|eukprot:ELU10341.1 hypothetical protein CAPTEDRAFT_122040 [Capitella teleta]